ERDIPFMKGYTVFNAQQIEGLPERYYKTEIEPVLAPAQRDERAEAFFAVLDGKEVGFALYFYNFSTFLGRSGLYLEDLYVQPEYRGQGIGKAIFRKLAATAFTASS
ncbi:MAG: GNAT family N-acetyltransferase, partial [Methanomicrobia archaeon]|nr:GNAT family N-acetyltransferase [Methanomicrobia archaeon]